MSRVLNLLRVLKLVVDGFNNGSLSEHQLIPERKQLVLHVPAHTSDQRDALLEE